MPLSSESESSNMGSIDAASFFKGDGVALVFFGVESVRNGTDDWDFGIALSVTTVGFRSRSFLHTAFALDRHFTLKWVLGYTALMSSLTSSQSLLRHSATSSIAFFLGGSGSEFNSRSIRSIFLCTCEAICGRLQTQLISKITAGPPSHVNIP